MPIMKKMCSTVPSWSQTLAGTPAFRVHTFKAGTDWTKLQDSYLPGGGFPQVVAVQSDIAQSKLGSDASKVKAWQ